jgi:DNA-binding MarR family transcriptional regulator
MKHGGGSPPAQSVKHLTLATFLPYRLNVAASVVSEGLARIYEERFGIGIPEWRVLATAGEFGTVTATAIGRHAHMGKVKVSRAVAMLEARGLIARAPNEEDRREAFLVLTRAGRAMYEEIVPLALGYAARLSAGLAPDERALLERLLDRLTEVAQDASRDRPQASTARAVPA